MAEQINYNDISSGQPGNAPENAAHPRSRARGRSRKPGVGKGAGLGLGSGKGTGTGSGRSGGCGLAVLIIIAAAMLFAGGVLAGMFGSRIAVAVSEYGSRTAEQEQLSSAESELGAFDPEDDAARLAGIKEYLADGHEVLETLRTFYPDDIIYAKDGNYVFVPRDYSLKTNNYDPDKVVKNSDGTWDYADDAFEVSKGIDVSSHQGEIDWEKASAGLDFVMIRAMYRGYESGRLVEDKYFKDNMDGAVAAGLDTGVYVFTQAVTEAEVDEELEMLKGLIGSYELSLPVVVDVEDVPDEEGRMDKLSREERTALVRYYCDRIEAEGYTPMLYFNIASAVSLVDLAEFEDVGKWFAVYDSDFYYPYAYKMWQYKDTGRIDGIEGNVDFNLMFTEK